MLKLLALVSVAGFAAAEICSDFDCTAAIAGGVQGADVQQQKSANDEVQCAACGTCTDTDRQVCCEPKAGDGKWINAAGRSMPDTVFTGGTACTGKNTVGGTPRFVAATDIADAICTPCTGTTTFAANGATDCGPVTHLACTGKKVDGVTPRRGTSVDGTADDTCAACVVGTSFGPADGSADCVAITACGTQQGGVTRVNGAATATADIGSCDGCGDGTAGTATGNCATWRTCTGKADGAGNDLTRVQTSVGTVTTQTVCTACSDGFFEATGNGDCVAHTTEVALNCGNTLATATTCAAPRVYIKGTATANAKCTPCAAGSYKVGAGNCLAHTTCGTQVGGASRLTGASDIAVGSCAACTAGTWGTAAGDCATQTVCGNALAILTCSAVARTFATNGGSLTAKATCTPCATGYDASEGNAGACIAFLASNAACGVAVTGNNAKRALTAGSATVNKACAACAGTTFAATGDLECKAQTPKTDCPNKLVGGADRWTATNNVIDSVCAPCAPDSFATDEKTDCAANTVCGNTLVATGACVVPRLSDASRTVAGTCTACAAGSYRSGAAPNKGDCLANTVCGAAVPGATALRASADASSTVAGTCADCAAGYWGTATGACVANTVCGNLLAGGTRLKDASRTVAGTCNDCAVGSWAKLGSDNCVAKTDLSVTCAGKLLAGAATRITPATLIADAICKPCALDSFAKDGATTCVAQPQCGNQVTELTCGAGVDRLTGATLLVTGACADCGLGTWAALGTDNCATYTAAGNQLTGETRAVGRSKILDQTSIADCAANTYALAKTGNCLANTVCGNLLAGGTRLKDASRTVAGTCNACADGSYALLGTDNCVACTAVDNAATGATYTCSSSTTTRFVGTTTLCTALTHFKVAGTTADSCAAVTACAGTNGHATPVTRVQVNAATKTADRTCTPCSTGFWAAAGDNTNCAAVTMSCGDQVAVGGAAAVMREITAPATITAEIVCGGCAVGTFPSSATGACTACTAVAGAKADATYSCNSASDSRVNKCLACAAKTVGATGATDTCTAACAVGTYRADSGDCTACTIANADATVGAVTYTCTSAADVRFATGGCTALTHYKVAGTNADSCAAVTTCSSNQLTGTCFPRVEVAAPTATTDRTCTPCAAGTFAADGQTNCAACDINNADATANAVTYTCTSAADVRFATGGCAATHYKVAGLTADSCALITACEVSAGVPSTQSTGACFPRVEVDAPTATTDRTCTPCAAGTFAANGQTDCAAHTTCGTQLGETASRLTGQSTIAAGSCAACTAGTFGADAVNCAACTPVANGSGLTCASAATSRVTACATTFAFIAGTTGPDTCVKECPCGQWAKTFACGPATVCPTLRCADHDTCGQIQASATLRATTTAGTATTNTVCADCAADTYAAGMWAKCASVTPCGNQLTCGARVQVDAPTTTADRTCTPCTDGTYATANGNCVECTAISGASAVTCTSGTDSRAATCVTLCPKKTSKTADTCKPTCETGYWDDSNTCTMCTAIAGNDNAVTCTSATTSKITSGACNNGYFLTAGTKDICTMNTVCHASRVQVTAATATADTVCAACATGTFSASGATACAACTPVAGAATGATYTCTSATDSRVNKCDTATSVKKVGAAGAMDTCTAKPVVPAGGGDTPKPAGSTPAGSGVSAANTATVGFASVVLAVVAAVGL